MSYLDKLPYRGVVIDRPCANCDTCDVHFQDECAMGPCTVCGEKRGTHYAWPEGPQHEWTPNHYQPALIAEAPVAFNAMITMVRHTGMPAHFMSDLYRDYQLLKGEGMYRHDAPPDRFVWGVRSTGTDLITEHTVRSTAQLLIERAEKLYAWNGHHLREIGRETAMVLTAKYRIGKRTGVYV